MFFSPEEWGSWEVKRLTRKEYYRECLDKPDNIVDIVTKYIETRTGPEFSSIKQHLERQLP